ncbi:unnamed protein product [Arctogadus glacialis]
MTATQLALLLWVPALLWPAAALPFLPGNIGQALGLSDGEGDGRILHRSKRGWMWNQFFLMEEYTGTDHQYVGKAGGQWSERGAVLN